MKSFFKALICLMFLGGNSFFAFYLDKIDVFGNSRSRKIAQKPTIKKIHSHFLKKQPQNLECQIVTDPRVLQGVIRDVLLFFNKYRESYQSVLSPQPFSQAVIDSKRVEDTLIFLDKVIEEDKKSGIFRINDPDFIKQNFDFVRWRSCLKDDKQKGFYFDKIRLTSYVIYQAAGSYEKTSIFEYPLYEVRDKKKQIFLNKQAILAMDHHQAERFNFKPLVWVTRDTLEEAMLQGTIILKMPDSKFRVFNVNVSNEYKFDLKKKLRKQDVYWFFGELGKSAVDRLIKRSKERQGVVFAGDIYSLGFGKLLAITYYNKNTKKNELRLGVLADTGSAFTGNLSKIDLFGGIVENKKNLKKLLNNYQPSVDAFILVSKENTSDYQA